MFKLITSAAIYEDDSRAFIIKHYLNKVSDNRAVLLISISIYAYVYKRKFEFLIFYHVYYVTYTIWPLIIFLKNILLIIICACYWHGIFMSWLDQLTTTEFISWYIVWTWLELKVSIQYHCFKSISFCNWMSLFLLAYLV